jgi:predicted PurR-regulated permease PerM
LPDAPIGCNREVTLKNPAGLDPEFDQRVARGLLDVLIRAGLIVVLALLCYQVFSPFVVLMEWALILAVTLYPCTRALAAKLGAGRVGRPR